MSTQTKSKTNTKKIAIAPIIAVVAIGAVGAYLIPAQSTVVIVPTTKEDQERYDALGVAQRYVVTSPTFGFDGDINSLKTEYVGTTKSIPPQHIFKATFESSHEGYGDRHGQSVKQITTPHTMEILVTEGNVVSAVTDQTWDEIKELFIQRTADPDFSMNVADVYNYASFIDALEKKDVTVELVEVLEDSPFAVPGFVVSVNGEHVQVYEFISATDAHDATLIISKDGTEIGTSIIRWMDEPHFYSQGNLIVQYIGHNPEMLSLLDSLLDKQFAGM